MVRPDYGASYYAYLLCYVYDIPSIAHDATSLVQWFDKHFKLKPNSLLYPDVYHGLELKLKGFHNRVWFGILVLHDV